MKGHVASQELVMSVVALCSKGRSMYLAGAGACDITGG